MRTTLSVIFFVLFITSSIADNYEKTLDRIKEISRSESIVGRNLNWVPADKFTSIVSNRYDNSGACPKEKIADLSKSVVRVHTPIFPACDIGGSEEERVRNPYDFNGCTGWRFSDTLFATAWHCMSEGEFSCRNTTIGFDYYPDLNELATSDEVASANWNRTATEKCSEIVYENKTLDIVIFRVSQNMYNKWGENEVLPILAGTGSFPTSDDKVMVLQYPSPEAPGCNISIAERIDIYDVYQMEQQVSYWSRKDPHCRLERRPTNNSIRWYSGRNPYPSDACSFEDKSKLVGPSGPITSIVYGCDTCPMSSGSPVISLNSTSERNCSVIGMHTHSGNGREQDTIKNVGLRMSVLGECIDFEKSQEDDAIALTNAGHSTTRPECRASIPDNVKFLDCTDKTMRPLKACEGYRLLQ